MINGSLLAANIGAMGYFLTDPAYASGISMLGATSAMSTLMGVSITRLWSFNLNDCQKASLTINTLKFYSLYSQIFILDVKTYLYFNVDLGHPDHGYRGSRHARRHHRSQQLLR